MRERESTGFQIWKECIFARVWTDREDIQCVTRWVNACEALVTVARIHLHMCRLLEDGGVYSGKDTPTRTR